ncbi:MAG: hypothetical protein U1A22_14730 [Xanthomonadaceae bacterium]|nr:hypothetical protein [Xanthomonadaceae bacterium]
MFEYLYRDAGNWKTWGSILLAGTVPAQAHELIERHCEMGSLFVAEQLGVRSLCERHYQQFGGPSELDHGYHEYHHFREATPDEVDALQVMEPAATFLARIVRIGGHWDVRLSPNAWR